MPSFYHIASIYILYHTFCVLKRFYLLFLYNLYNVCFICTFMSVYAPEIYAFITPTAVGLIINTFTCINLNVQ